jgi:glycosyltransferase involved in cell wall biosynthesis
VKIDISIPIYNQPNYLNQLLLSLKNQSYFNGSIMLYDDSSNLSYDLVISNYQNLNITYIRNDINLGSLYNMEKSYNEAISTPRQQYIMVPHEDDILSVRYLEVVKNICTSNKKYPALILSSYKEFIDESEIAESNISSDVKYNFISKADLALLFLKGSPFAFGSAIYSVNKYQSMKFDLDKYGEFADRPFILNTLSEHDEILILSNPLYFLRSHVNNDYRWKLLCPNHVYNLLNFYRSIIQPQNRKNIKEFKKFSTLFVLDSFLNLQLSRNTPIWLIYLTRGYKQGLVSIKYVLLRNKLINKTFTKFMKHL